MENAPIKEMQICVFDSTLLFCKEKANPRCASKKKEELKSIFPFFQPLSVSLGTHFILRLGKP